jgi:3-isopropylmalate dehydratase small subunit
MGVVRHGIRCVIAVDFGDIFYLNSLKSGVLPVALDLKFALIWGSNCTPSRARPSRSTCRRRPSPPDGAHRFAIGGFRKKCLLEGLDASASPLL